MEQILRKQKVRDITGLSNTQIDRMEHENRFPRRRQITERIVGWSFNEIQAWINARLHGESEAAQRDASA